MTTLQWVAVILPSAVALVSEIMPFVKSAKANGILHALYLALQGAEKVLPPPPSLPKDSSLK